MKKYILPFLGLGALAGCVGADANGGRGAYSWSASYAQPYDAMTYCLSARSIDYVAITGIDARQGIGTVSLTFKRDNSSAGEFVVRRLGEKSSEVHFRSSVRTLGGGEFMDRQARENADRCASPTG